MEPTELTHPPQHELLFRIRAKNKDWFTHQAEKERETSTKKDQHRKGGTSNLRATGVYSRRSSTHGEQIKTRRAGESEGSNALDKR